MNTKIIKKGNKIFKQVEEELDEKGLRHNLALLEAKKQEIENTIKKINDTLEEISSE